MSLSVCLHHMVMWPTCVNPEVHALLSDMWLASSRQCTVGTANRRSWCWRRRTCQLKSQWHRQDLSLRQLRTRPKRVTLDHSATMSCQILSCPKNHTTIFNTILTRPKPIRCDAFHNQHRLWPVQVRTMHRRRDWIDVSGVGWWDLCNPSYTKPLGPQALSRVLYVRIRCVALACTPGTCFLCHHSNENVHIQMKNKHAPILPSHHIKKYNVYKIVPPPKLNVELIFYTHWRCIRAGDTVLLHLHKYI